MELAMLELSIARSELVVRERHWRSRARLAAGYGWRILTNRPFAEGNKRMALAAMVTCLEMNGFTWNCGEVEETAMVLRAAAKEMKEDEWEAWVVRNVGKKDRVKTRNCQKHSGNCAPSARSPALSRS